MKKNKAKKSYTLRDKDGTPLSLEEFSSLMENPKYSRVASDEVGDYWVSTVWVGIRMTDNSGGLDAIFETLVFPRGKSLEVYGERYKTLDEAKEGHQRIVQMVKDDGLPSW